MVRDFGWRSCRPRRPWDTCCSVDFDAAVGGPGELEWLRMLTGIMFVMCAVWRTNRVHKVCALCSVLLSVHLLWLGHGCSKPTR